jgi:hypothetical protein
MEGPLYTTIRKQTQITEHRFYAEIVTDITTQNSEHNNT